MSYFDSRAYRMCMLGLRAGLSSPARLFNTYRRQQSANPYWCNMYMLFTSMIMVNVFGHGVERAICFKTLEPAIFSAQADAKKL